MAALVAELVDSVQKFKPVGLRFYPQLNEFVSPAVLVGSGVGYLAVILLLWLAMRNRTAFGLKFFMTLYNLTQIGLCAYMSYGLLIALMQAPALSLGLPNIFGFNLPFTPSVEALIFLHYVSKFLDFFDTIFIVLRKKDEQLNFLHLFHHATIGPVWGLLLLLGYGSGACAYGAFLNSVVHTIMYSHYLMGTFGIPNPFKKYITQIQLFQFALCFTQAMITIFTPIETVYPKALAVLQVTYHVLMMSLFSSFYSRKYKKTGGKGKKLAVAITEEPTVAAPLNGKKEA